MQSDAYCRPLAVLMAAFTAVLIALSACSGHSGLPAPGSTQYRAFTSAFYVGLAGLETGEDTRAQQKLTLASELAPGEAATWANLALFAARQQNFDAAFTDAEKARERAPRDSRVEALLGFIEARRGKLSEAIVHLRKAVDLDGKNLKALYGLAEQTEREGGPASEADAQALFQRALSEQPRNLAILLDLTRLSAKRGDVSPMRDGIARLRLASAAWPEEARQRLTALQSVSESNPRAAAVQVNFLRNVLARVPDYRQSINAVRTPSAFVGEPFSRFLNLPNPNSTPAPADSGLRFTAGAPAGVPARDVAWAGAMPLDSSATQYTITADVDSLQITGGAKLARPPGALTRNGVLGADLNYDFKTDLVIASTGGLRLYQQRDPAHFEDFTLRSKLPTNVINGAYSGAWAFDIDLDGDLDIILGNPEGDPVILRNNGDNTFAVVHTFPGVKGLISFASADIDGDGDPDVAMVDGQGDLHVFSNERLGEFRPRPIPANLKGHFLTVVAGDLNSDGMPDFIALRDDGSVVRLSDQAAGAAWDVAEIIKAGGGPLKNSSANLIAADFDNNGSLDLLAGDGRLFLGGSQGLLPSAALPPGITVTSAVDLSGNGRLALIGYSTRAIALVAQGTRNYNWQTLRVRAAKASGDQRINSFGIGGEVEIRSGLLTQKQVITSSVLHFGLGEHQQSDVARIVWPNGSVQAEFELKSDQSLLAEQRLKGSCPFLFAWNGKQIAFVKDGQPWSPALGLHINAQVVAGISQTQEWFKIPGEALAPRNGYYDLRVTGELWETYYIDHYSLLVVDHPANTEVFTDERFSSPPPALRIYTVSTPQPFASARDDRGEDVSPTVHSVDGRYLDTFGRGRYQGVTRDHWVELTLPDSAPRTGPLYLIGAGWMHPTDGTVNVALGQNSDPPPQGLRIEVPDSRGNWVTAQSGLGFLAGRNKTAVLAMTNIFRPGAPRKLRLRTNLEIYWDRLSWATGLPDSNARIQRSPLTYADLHYRGFSQVDVADASSPEIPNYDRLSGTGQKWRDLEGYYTRYGDIRELLEKIDNRIVITNAGDELLLRFAELPATQSGWKRDYIMIGDGWIKDGDYNSVFSKTVLPLPYHAMKDYAQKPSTLEKDPAYLLHPEDWQRFHTRYVTPDAFIHALWN